MCITYLKRTYIFLIWKPTLEYTAYTCGSEQIINAIWRAVLTIEIQLGFSLLHQCLTAPNKCPIFLLGVGFVEEFSWVAIFRLGEGFGCIIFLCDNNSITSILAPLLGLMLGEGSCYGWFYLGLWGRGVVLFQLLEDNHLIPEAPPRPHLAITQILCCFHTLKSRKC